MDHNSQGRRPHFHRGRRGQDRRGLERRERPLQQEQAARSGDHVDVEQIMRDIRARIATNHGIELSAQQIQELAARRLEAILDPRVMKPELMEQLRKGAGVARQTEMDSAPREVPYTFDDASLFGSHRGLLRAIRTLLNPILKLFLNPVALVQALKAQAALNAEAAVRDADRDRRQAEWNALHYELVQRIVTETARVSIEMQSLSMRVEALSGKVDFNERRVRTMESAPQQPKPGPRSAEPHVSAVLAPRVSSVNVTDVPRPASDERPAADGARPPETERAGDGARAGDGQRRKRRRRRGRRSGGPVGDNVTATGLTVAGSVNLAGGTDEDEADGDDGPEADPSASMSVEGIEAATEATAEQATASVPDLTPALRFEQASPAGPDEPAPSVPERVDRPESDPAEE